MTRSCNWLFGALLGTTLTAGLPLYPAVSHGQAPGPRQVESSTRADAIIEAATPAMVAQLIGRFEPANALEKDILAAALLDIEGRQLHRAAMAGDASARARRREIADIINGYEKQHAALRSNGKPFGYQWRILSGQLVSAQLENLIPAIRELYEARYGARDAASRRRAQEMLAADQKAAQRAGQSREVAPQARAACGPASDGTSFDLNDIDKSLRWWVARTRELGTAQRSGNQIRVDAARRQFRGQLACLVNQRVTYTFRVQPHPIRDDPVISAQGVLVGVYHASDRGVIRVGAERDARGITHAESAPILLRAGRDVDAGVLPRLGTRSTFVASARIARTGVLGATSLRPPTLILFVTDVKVERIKPCRGDAAGRIGRHAAAMRNTLRKR